MLDSRRFTPQSFRVNSVLFNVLHFDFLIRLLWQVDDRDLAACLICTETIFAPIIVFCTLIIILSYWISLTHHFLNLSLVAHWHRLFLIKSVTNLYIVDVKLRPGKLQTLFVGANLATILQQVFHSHLILFKILTCDESWYYNMAWHQVRLYTLICDSHNEAWFGPWFLSDLTPTWALNRVVRVKLILSHRRFPRGWLVAVISAWFCLHLQTNRFIILLWLLLIYRWHPCRFCDNLLSALFPL